MNTPKVQTDADAPPTEGANPDIDRKPAMPHGIPKGTTDAQATGTPTSDRQQTEATPAEKQPSKP